MMGSVRVGVACWLAMAGVQGRGQGSTLPAAEPTVSSAAAAQTTYAAPKQEASKKARVTWVGGELTIAAENSSLNQILREVSRVTGMKVTGGVAEERVYGSYGPGAPDEVLRILLTGMGTNMLLKVSEEGAPMELALTPRQGGATPPGPASFAGHGDEREDDLPPQRIVPSSRARFDAGRPGTSEVPPAGNPGGVPNPAAATIGTSTTAPAAVGTDQQSPNGVKTPQQIYDQLMQLQKQKAATPP